MCADCASLIRKVHVEAWRSHLTTSCVDGRELHIVVEIETRFFRYLLAESCSVTTRPRGSPLDVPRRLRKKYLEGRGRERKGNGGASRCHAFGAADISFSSVLLAGPAVEPRELLSCCVCPGPEKRRQVAVATRDANPTPSHGPDHCLINRSAAALAFTTGNERS